MSSADTTISALARMRSVTRAVFVETTRNTIEPTDSRSDPRELANAVALDERARVRELRGPGPGVGHAARHRSSGVPRGHGYRGEPVPGTAGAGAPPAPGGASKAAAGPWPITAGT